MLNPKLARASFGCRSFGRKVVPNSRNSHTFKKRCEILVTLCFPDGKSGSPLPPNPSPPSAVLSASIWTALSSNAAATRKEPNAAIPPRAPDATAIIHSLLFWRKPCSPSSKRAGFPTSSSPASPRRWSARPPDSPLGHPATGWSNFAEVAPEPGRQTRHQGQNRAQLRRHLSNFGFRAHATRSPCRHLLATCGSWRPKTENKVVSTDAGRSKVPLDFPSPSLPHRRRAPCRVVRIHDKPPGPPPDNLRLPGLLPSGVKRCFRMAPRVVVSSTKDSESVAMAPCQLAGSG